MQEAKDEWLIEDESNYKFHFGQYDTPYRSTVAFEKFLRKNTDFDSREQVIVDVACGGEHRPGILPKRTH